MEGLAPTERDAVAEALRALARTTVLDEGLSASAVHQLVAEGFQIGFHTRRHDVLPRLSDSELRAALTAGREPLERIAGRALTEIAYPHGHADLRVAHAASEAGFTTGLMWRGGPVGEQESPLLVDRVDGWAPSLDAFKWRLGRVISRGIDS
jgi:peptidoglycan/xylan/chitin deacetylase (PgdA/CDA1 family)